MKNLARKIVVEQLNEVVEDHNPEQQSIGPYDNYKIQEVQEHVYTIQKAPSQREPQTTTIGKEPPQEAYE